jgi:fermentation-respiration switch protein FrsA (DUF1100 family)
MRRWHAVRFVPRSPLMQIALTLLVLYLGLCAAVWLVQRRLLYFPGGPPEVDPGAVGLPFEDVEVTAADGVRLHGWWLPARDGEPVGAVLVFHGNAGNIADRIPLARALTAMQLDVLLFDYRGYGSSQGRPTAGGLGLDGEAMHDWLVRRMEQRGLASERIAYFGESLGAAVAIDVAQRRRITALVTEAAFTSVADVARSLYWFLPVDLLVRDRFASIGKLGSLDVPLLAMHSPADEIVPFIHSERLVAAARSAELLRLDGGHNAGGFQRSPAHAATLQAFLHRHLRPD